MIVIGDKGKKGIIFVLSPDSLSRLKKGDPFTINIKEIGYPDLNVVIGYADDAAIHESKGPYELTKHVFRSYEEKPEDDFKPYRIEEAKVD